MICPVCHNDQPEELYFDLNDYIVGCDWCISIKDAGEYETERAEAIKDYFEEHEWRSENERI